MTSSDNNPARLKKTAQIRKQLQRLEKLEESVDPKVRTQLAKVRENLAAYVEWNHVDAQAVRQNMILRDPDTGARR